MGYVFSFLGMILFIILGVFVFVFLKKEKQCVVNILQNENVLYEDLQKVKMTIVGFRVIFFYGLFFVVFAMCGFWELRKNLPSGFVSVYMFVTWLIWVVEFFFATIWSALLSVKVNKLYRYVCHNYVVEANVEKYEKGRWICKFSRNGEYIAYLSKKPSSKKIKALVVDYDWKNRIYKLQELVEG